MNDQTTSGREEMLCNYTKMIGKVGEKNISIIGSIVISFIIIIIWVKHLVRKIQYYSLL